MGLEDERKFSNGLINRRNLLIEGFALWAVACSSTISESDPSVRIERPNTPLEGDVFIDYGKGYLRRNEGKYLVPDLERYLVGTKNYGRKQFSLQDNPALRDIFDRYPLIKAPAEETIIDPYTGNIKDGKKFGGEVNLFIPGMLTDQGNLYSEIVGMEDTFVRQRKRLEAEGFYHQDNFHFTWGAKRIDNYKAAYKAADTVKPLSENLPHILEWIDTIKHLLPFAQLNIFIHSLPGIFLADIIENHADAINNIFLFSSPVRGLKEDPLRVVAVRYIRDYIRARFSIEEHVTPELFALGKDPDYLNRLDRLSRNFVRSGRGLYVARAKDDPFVPVESTELPEAKEKEISVGSGGILDLLTKPLEVLKAHGRSLGEPEIVDGNAKAIGRNLASV